MFFAGIDLGSTMTKAVIINSDEEICSAVIHHTGAEHRQLANEAMEEALAECDLDIDNITFIVATGYGRITVPFADTQVTELTCHARGVSALFPDAKLVIDIGGQDAKGMQINNGRLIDFVMSDKCAAGTGRFFEIMANTLDIDIDELGNFSLKAENKVSVNSTCTVFARQEVISRLSEGESVEDVLAGIHDAIAVRTVRMLHKLKVEPDVIFTGGVAENKGVVQALENRLGCRIFVPENPMLTGALGAAVIAKEKALKALAKGEHIQKEKRQLDKASFFRKGTS
ncbi:MAG: 2-hydroxyglutaryl-CoA dehydratase [Spirochaetes bacterium]|nr:2-hydroxyglutaryl-CoA dehydratase [Spirochaetota bacterium]